MTSAEAGRSQEDWRRKWNAFLQTPVGKAFNAFDTAQGNAWRVDTELGFQEYPNEKHAKVAWARSDAAREELLKLLYEVAGI